MRIFGGILIALGSLAWASRRCCCWAGRSTPGNAGNPALLYAVFAATFVALGFGSIWGRRWARDLILVGTVFSLATMLLAMPFAIWIVLRIFVANTSLLGNEGTVGCVITASLVFLFVIFIALPLAFLLFYARRDVRFRVPRASAS